MHTRKSGVHGKCQMIIDIRRDEPNHEHKNPSLLRVYIYTVFLYVVHVLRNR